MTDERLAELHALAEAWGVACPGVVHGNDAGDVLGEALREIDALRAELAAVRDGEERTARERDLALTHANNAHDAFYTADDARAKAVAALAARDAEWLAAMPGCEASEGRDACETKAQRIEYREGGEITYFCQKHAPKYAGDAPWGSLIRRATRATEPK